MTLRSDSGWAADLGRLAGSDVRRSVVVVVDQGLASASNFALALVVGRWLGPDGLGALAVVLAVWLIAYGLFRALIEDPLAIMAETMPSAVALSAGLSLSVAVSAVLLATWGGLALLGIHAKGILALAIILLPLFLQDFWRRLAFLARRPSAALLNDAAYCCVELGAFLTCHTFGLRTLTAALTCWGLGACVGAAIGFRQFRVWPARLMTGARALWNTRGISLWLGLDFLVNRSIRQAYVFIVAAAAGTGALGGIQASNNLLSFTNILILGGGSAALAEGSVRLREAGVAEMRRSVVVVTSIVAALVVACAVLYWALAGPILTTVFGTRFAPYVYLAPIVGLQAVVGSAELLPATELRLIRETRRMFYTRLALVPIGIATVWPLCAYAGVTGAAIAGVAVVGSLTAGAWIALGLARKRQRLNTRREVAAST